MSRLVLTDQDFFSVHDSFEVLKNHFDQLKIWDINLSREANISNAEGATVGIAKAELALAESGTVVMFSHLGSGRSVTLLPTYKVIIIRKQDLRPRLTQAMSFLREQVDAGLSTTSILFLEQVQQRILSLFAYKGFSDQYPYLTLFMIARRS